MTEHSNASAAQPRVADISVAEAMALHGKAGVVFVDVREPAEVRAGKVKDAVTIPRGSLPEETDQLRQAQTVILYCAAGGRAALAGDLLLSMGFDDVRNMGGYKDWAAAGGATE